jgi:hypothetical protein
VQERPTSYVNRGKVCTMADKQGDDVLVPSAKGNRRYAPLVSGVHVSPLGQKQLNHCRVPLARGLAEWRMTPLVRRVHIRPFGDKQFRHVCVTARGRAGERRPQVRHRVHIGAFGHEQVGNFAVTKICSFMQQRPFGLTPPVHVRPPGHEATHEFKVPVHHRQRKRCVTVSVFLVQLFPVSPIMDDTNLQTNDARDGKSVWHEGDREPLCPGSQHFIVSDVSLIYVLAVRRPIKRPSYAPCGGGSSYFRCGHPASLLLHSCLSRLRGAESTGERKEPISAYSLDQYNMTQRERFIRYMTFQPVDRIPLMDMGVWPETLERWHHEGLPKWVTDLRHLEDYLGLDRSFNMNWLPITSDVYPPFEVKVLEETEDTVVMRDDRGVVYQQRKHHKTIPHFLRFPIENEKDYDELLPKLNGADPGRYAEDFDEDLHWRTERGEIRGVNFRSFFGFCRNYMGAEKWCMAFYDQPNLVRRMIADRLEFGKALFKRVLDKGALDFVQIWEDMSFKTASLISPRLVREHMLPAYVEFVKYLREGGVKIIMVDSDGWVGELLPIFMEAGMDGCHPCEIAAGSDPSALRRIAPRCALMGGMDKRAIASGPAGVDTEMQRIEPALKEGAFIPMLDHFVPPDVSYDTYRYYVECRRERLCRPWPVK